MSPFGNLAGYVLSYARSEHAQTHSSACHPPGIRSSLGQAKPKIWTPERKITEKRKKKYVHIMLVISHILLEWRFRL